MVSSWWLRGRIGAAGLREGKGELRWLRDERGWFAREPEKEEETAVGGGAVWVERNTVKGKLVKGEENENKKG